MRKSLFSIFFLFTSIILLGQTPGEWTWMGGTDSVNSHGVYGTKGVSSPLNNPPGIIFGSNWTDAYGNFWVYGGETINGYSNDLWKYDLATHQWTWINGSKGVSDQMPVYGIYGVADTNNTPGERQCSGSWTDNQGNLWLFGGEGYLETGWGCGYHDLWRYDPLLKMWTWMKGDTTCGINGFNAHYGVKGIEDSMNNPSYTHAMGVTWTDNFGYLWMVDVKGCMWRYNIQSNNWCWMNGDTLGHAKYGQKFTPSTTTTPGATEADYTRWKDSAGNFWYLYSGASYYSNALFKYYPSLNEWAWMWGDTTWMTVDVKYGDTICDFSPINEKEEITPWPRVECSACWIDQCNNLWLFGGSGGGGFLNDLVYYNTNRNIWVRVGLDTITNSVGYWGSQGVSNPNNNPPNRIGALPFMDDEGNLWFFGGAGYPGANFPYADIWRFGMDSGCSPCGDEFAHISALENKIPSIYPNPGIGRITIENNKEIDEIVVSDILGKVIKFQSIHTKRYDLELPYSGIYFLTIFSGGNKTTLKVVLL